MRLRRLINTWPWRLSSYAVLLCYGSLIEKPLDLDSPPCTELSPAPPTSHPPDTMSSQPTPNQTKLPPAASVPSSRSKAESSASTLRGTTQYDKQVESRFCEKPTEFLWEQACCATLRCGWVCVPQGEIGIRYALCLLPRCGVSVDAVLPTPLQPNPPHPFSPWRVVSTSPQPTAPHPTLQRRAPFTPSHLTPPHLAASCSLHSNLLHTSP